MSTTETIDEQDTSTSMSTSTSTSISISTSTSTTAKAEDKRKRFVIFCRHNNTYLCNFLLRREAIPAGEVEEYEDLASGLGVLENSLSEPSEAEPLFLIYFPILSFESFQNFADLASVTTNFRPT